MAHLHSKNISKGRRIAGYVLSVLPSLMILFSGTMKVIGFEPIVESMTKIGIQDKTLMIGLIEIACVILYWIPKTSNVGFFLLCSYAGGIIAAEMAMGSFPLPGLVVAVMLYVGTMLRKKELSGLGI